jgi:WS/DGAT/MGAT family acyltransferase
MHLGALIICEGPPPSLDELLEQIRGRLHLVPRYRQKLAHTALDSGRPVWIDDPTFNAEYHVRHTALPAGGDWDRLQGLTARIFSQALDRQKPLWEMWLVEGLKNDRFALISKTHHALIDGIAGIDLATVLFDLSPEPPALRHSSGRPWAPHAEPGTRELLATALRGALRTEARLAGAIADAVSNPERAVTRAREALEGLGEIVWAVLNPAPATPLNVEIGPYRRFVGIGNRLQDFRFVKDTFGGTVNDVVLSVVTGALRSFLISRGVRTEGLELRALVPVSVRGAGEHGEMGNRIVAIRGALPVFITDPVERLRYISAAMAGLKESKQALGAKVIAGAQNFAPPTILAQASRLNFSTRLFNLIVTNIPGPQFPLYVLGRQLQQAYPVAFLPAGQVLSIAIMSYNGEMNFSLLGDFDALPDIDQIGRSVADELATLVSLASEASGTPLLHPASVAEQRPSRAPSRSRGGAGGKRSPRPSTASDGGTRAPARDGSTRASARDGGTRARARVRSRART